MMRRRLLSAIMCLCMVFALFSAGMISVSASGDTTPPIIERVEIDVDECTEGNTFTVTVYATDEGSGIPKDEQPGYLYLERDWTEDGKYSQVRKHLELQIEENGVYTASVKLDNSWVTGTYYISDLCIRDRAFNEAWVSYSDDNSVLKDTRIKLVTSNSDFSGPEILDVLAESQTVHANERITITIQFEDESGLNLDNPGEVYLYRETEEGEIARSQRAEITPVSSNTCNAVFNVDDTWVSGKYYIDYIALYDVNNNRTALYDYPQIKEQLDNIRFEVLTAIADARPPVITRVDMESATVKPGESFEVIVFADNDDDVSEDVGIVSIIGLDNDGNYSEQQSNLIKVGPGEYHAQFIVKKSWEPGSYSVRCVSMWDAYENDTYVYSDSENDIVSKNEVKVIDTIGPSYRETPQVKDVRINGDSFNEDDEIRIDLTLEITEIPVNEEYPGSVTLQRQSEEGESYVDYNVELKKIDDTHYQAVKDVKDMTSGEYCIRYIDICDQRGDYTSYEYARDYDLIPQGLFSVSTSHSDVRCPIVEKIEVDSQTVGSGDTFEILITAYDLESGIAQDNIGYVGIESIDNHRWYMSSDLERVDDTHFKARFEVFDHWPATQFQIEEVIIRDSENNSAYVFKEDDRIPASIITVKTRRTEFEEPKVTKVYFDTKQVQEGQSFHVYVEAEDIESGVDEFSPGGVTIKRIRTNDKEREERQYSDLSKVSENLYAATFQVDEYWFSGEYILGEITVNDNAYNRLYLGEDSALLPTDPILITTRNEDLIPPEILSVDFDKSTVEDGDTFAVFVTMRDNSVIDQEEPGEVALVRYPESEEEYNFYRYASLEKVSGNEYKAVFKVDGNWFAGDYGIDYVLARDASKNIAEDYPYNEATVIPTKKIRVHTEKTDFIRPEILSINLNKTSFEAGDTMEIRVDARDANSGFEEADVCGYINISRIKEDENESKFGFYVPLYLNREGVLVGEYSVTNGLYSGDYQIDSVNIWDRCYNELYITREDNSEMLEGKTFHVTTALSDLIGPDVRSVDHDEISASSGESFVIKVTMEDPSGINEEFPGVISLVLEGDDSMGSEKNGYLKKTNENTYTATFAVDDSWTPGKYVIYGMRAEDIYENATVLLRSENPSFFPNKSIIITDNPEKHLATVMGHNLNLSGSIGVNYFIHFSDEVLADEGAKVHFELPNGLTSEVMVKDAKVQIVKDVECREFGCKLHSSQMTGIIKAKVLLSDGTESEEFPYTVKEYADLIIANPDNNSSFTKVTPLIKAMLNYGGYAQEYFKYDDNPLANKDMTAEERNAINAVKAEDVKDYERVVTGSQEGLVYEGSNLMLTSETCIRHFFTVQSGHDISEYSFKMDGKTLPPVKSGKMYYVEISNIASGNLDSTYTVTVGGLTIKYSALSYVYTQLSKGDLNPDLGNTLKALYLYNQKANIYFKK